MALQRLSCSIKNKCLEVHFGHVQLNYRTEIQTTCNEYSACSGIAAHLMENSSVCVCLIYLFHMMVLHGNLPMKLTSVLLFMLWANIRADKADRKMKMNIILLFCNGKPKLQQKLSCSMQYHCLSTMGVWFTVCREGRKKALSLPFLLRLRYLHQWYLSQLRQHCKKCG